MLSNEMCDKLFNIFSNDTNTITRPELKVISGSVIEQCENFLGGTCNRGIDSKRAFFNNFCRNEANDPQHKEIALNCVNVIREMKVVFSHLYIDHSFQMNNFVNIYLKNLIKSINIEEDTHPQLFNLLNGDNHV